MRGRKDSLKKSSSGQLLIVAALAIALLISSTTTYVYEVTRETDNARSSSISNFVLAMKQTTRNAMISSLANVSNGGAKSTLASNLGELSEAVGILSRFGFCILGHTTLSELGYDFGTKLQWGDNGLGVSGAYANFTLQVQDEASRTTMKFEVNMTASLAISGSYATLGSGEKNVSLICNVCNNGHPSLTGSLKTFYHDASSWTEAGVLNSLAVTDYANGTYLVSFVVAISDPVQVSVQVIDLQGIFIRANTTCTAS